ncbi:MAG: glycerol kinase [Alphaproteobacteria bacterium]|jgi:glycerol kinase
MQGILSIDQGTTSTRAIIFSKNGKVLAKCQKEHKQHYSAPDHVEHDADEIWQNTKQVTCNVIQQAQEQNINLLTLGITNQRETIVCWDKNTGEPLHNAIVWQDKRTAHTCEQLKAISGDIVQQKTGLPLDPYFSASKLAWLLENVEAIKQAKADNRLLCGTVDSFLLYKLTDGKVHKTDITNACRTLLFNIHEKCWDVELLDIFNIPPNILPEVCSNSEHFGDVAKGIFPIELPIHSLIGDQQAATVGQGCFSKGTLKSTYGTGCFAMMNIGKEVKVSDHGLLTTICYQVGHDVTYALEGSIFVAGSAVQWLRDSLGLIKTAAETEVCAKRASDNDNVYFVPAFAGLGAPYWHSSAKGLITGMTFDTDKNIIIRATLDAVCYQTYDLIKAMENDCGIQIQTLKVDGGMTENNWLCTRMADILDCIVLRPKIAETTALGAAYMAGLGCGLYNNFDDIEENWQLDKVFKSTMKADVRKQKLIGWASAIKTSVAA